MRPYYDSNNCYVLLGNFLRVGIPYFDTAVEVSSCLGAFNFYPNAIRFFWRTSYVLRVPILSARWRFIPVYELLFWPTHTSVLLKNFLCVGVPYFDSAVEISSCLGTFIFTQTHLRSSGELLMCWHSLFWQCGGNIFLIRNFYFGPNTLTFFWRTSYVLTVLRFPILTSRRRFLPV